MMRLGIMQPYFFPYAGYFSVLKHVDEYILFDTAQFIRHGWIERNRILKDNGDWQYVSVPLASHTRETAIKDIKIRVQDKWQDKILAQIRHYKWTPYFKDVEELLKKCLYHDTDSIVEIDRLCLQTVCEYLDIDTPISVFSERKMHIGEVSAPDEWALEICKACGADEYWNTVAGLELFDIKKYQNAGIKICFHELNFREYKQKRNMEHFEAGLSILDLMMFLSPKEINDQLDDYKMIRGFESSGDDNK